MRHLAGYGGWQAVWVGAHKLVRSRPQTGPPKTELFDLAHDPGETNDLSAAQPELLERLLALLAREHTRSVTFPLAAIDGH